MKLFPIYTWTKGIRNFDKRRNRFSKQPWAQGLILLGCVVVAMLLANLPFTREAYHNFLNTGLSLNFLTPGGDSINFPRGMTVEKFINDVLMVIFFFVVGLEIRREMDHGELSSPKKAILPVVAAVGGVCVPAIIFTLINHGTAAASGWGIPTATDIAFSIGILTMLGDRVPMSLKIFLTTLAVADDLIAILVVAIFYGGKINFALLGAAIVVILLVVLMNRLGEKRDFWYIMAAIVVWVLFYYAGIHSTMSGVVMAFLIPVKPRFNRAYYYRKREQYRRRLSEWDALEGPDDFPNGPQRHCLRRLSHISRNCIGMADRVEHVLSPWVNFLIMPLFALANAGVTISDPSYFNIFRFSPELGSVSLGVFLGLLLGKPIGITAASWLAIKLKIGDMPSKASWLMLFSVACLGGIGFTMSIFVDTLSFSDQLPEVTAALRDMGKIAVLLGSLCAGIFGTLMIRLTNAVEKKK